jgi:hypothetical protein
LLAAFHSKLPAIAKILDGARKAIFASGSQ